MSDLFDTASLDAEARPSRARRKMANRLAVPTSYRFNPADAYNAAWFYPGFMVVPSSIILPLAGALTVLRVGIFIAFLLAFREVLRKLLRGGFVLVLSDLFVPAMGAWMVGTIVYHQGAGGLVGYGTVAALEFCFTYLIARVFFGTPAGYEQFIRVLKVAVVAILISALADTATGMNVVSRVGAMLTRVSAGELADVQRNYRFGLIRAQGSLEHPILLGVFGAIAVILFFFSRLNQTQKLVWCSISAFMAMLALSSAAFLSLTFFFGAAVFGRIFRHHPWKWKALAMMALFGVGCLFILVDNPVETMIRNLTLDPQTGLFRLQIWQWVGLNVQRHPFVGIGFADWARPDNMPPSIDSLWLIQSIRNGLPAAILLGAAMLTTGFALPLHSRRSAGNAFIANAHSGLGIAIFIYAFNAFTVHFWGTNWTLLAAILGMRAGFTECLYLTPFARADDANFGAAPTALFSRTMRLSPFKSLKRRPHPKRHRAPKYGL
ncbi:hypothetical protein GCM10007036_18450 [Alsobacter metallidurans]|uniref:O-antigen ligase-related domain-containing protein n=1 Tax=Alsobacter metallidurans TaxID=340221 RepID=A0A917I6S0_9HYPH|nr:O-antigen ligase family protein [Alsobacter metallidurans]GGH17184.1 hypothetical protein GCM10007036_18450 [Alsobacter metallidurans]